MLAFRYMKEIEWYFKHEDSLRTVENSFYTEIKHKNVCSPASWLDVIEKTYALHNGLICRAMEKRYKYMQQTQFIISDMGISRKTYFEWRKEFLTDALLLACSKKLIKVTVPL